MFRREVKKPIPTRGERRLAQNTQKRRRYMKLQTGQGRDKTEGEGVIKIGYRGVWGQLRKE